MQSTDYDRRSFSDSSVPGPESGRSLNLQMAARDMVASTIEFLQSTASTYKELQNFSGLPKEFNEVNRHLPLAQRTLSLADSPLNAQTVDGAATTAIKDCNRVAEKLCDIFKKVNNEVKNKEDKSLLEIYRTSLLHLDKSYRVETLMSHILSHIKTLATNQLFKTAMQSQMARLEEAIGQLSNVVSSVPDSDFDDGVKSFTQNISGGTGYQAETQYNNHGSGQQNNFSGGVGTVNLGAQQHDR